MYKSNAAEISTDCGTIHRTRPAAFVSVHYIALLAVAISLFSFSPAAADNIDAALPAGYAASEASEGKYLRSSPANVGIEAAAGAQLSTGESCSTPSGSGICEDTSTCSSAGGTSIAGYCPGASNIQCCITTSCSTPSGSGICEDTSTCSSAGGSSIAGYCPGASNIQCCIPASCSTPYGSGICEDTSICSAAGGTSYSGYCPGASNIQCCVSSSPGPDGTAEYGIDVSSAVSSSTASCFKNAGMTFIIPRGYRSSGSVDPNVCTTLKNTQSAGIKTRDVYMFPCPTCSKSASAQMSELVSYLSSNCKTAWSGRVWLDIEGTQYWYSSTSTNRSWYQNLVDSCKTYGVQCGVYASYYQWQSIFGSTSYSYGSNLPLWYAHYDNNPTFSDFNSFGGWTSPHVKQYVGDTTVCSMDVDKNYAAHGF